MASIFEKTMQACKESKNLTEKKSVKATKPIRKAINESKISKKRIKKESDEEDDLEMETADDIVAVIDPDLDADEMTSVAQGFQQLIDDAGANEIPETDEYIDNHIYGCPICGQKFFSEVPMGDGDTCPVCGETADGFVMVGEVEASEGADTEETQSEDDEFDIDGNKIEVDIDEESDDEEEEVEESKKATRRSARSENRSALRGSMARRTTRESRRKSSKGMNLDEKTFNPYLNRFVRENYENAKTFNIVGAKKKGDILTLECKITFKSGKAKRVNLECKYNPKSNILMAKDTKKAFKVESANTPFIFKIRTVGNVIRCEGMKYNFTTSANIKNENKKVRVSGSYMKEAKTRRPSVRRAMESRRITRRPTTRRMESRRVARRPMTRRSAVESRRLATRRVRPSVHTTESRRLARRRPVARTMESRRIARRPMTRRVESTRIARRPATRSMRSERMATRRPSVRRSMRSESSRVARRPMARRSVRSEGRRIARKPMTRSMRSEGARRNVSTRRSIRR